MGYSQYPAITDELLSAYIDNAVSAAERAAVETAIANDLEIAWRVESLRSTVSLLGQLSDVPLPRSFTLDDALVEMAPVSEPPRPALHPHSTDSSDSLWERWLDFWRSGSVAWRNAAAVCALLLLVFLVGDFAIVNETQATQDEMASIALDETTDTPMLAMDESEAAPAPAAVAMLPEPTNQAEERVVPVPMAAMETAEEERSETEAESVQPATVAMNRESEIEKETADETVEETILLKDSPSDDSVVEGIQADIGTAEEAGEAPPAATMALSSASMTAGDAMTESALRLSPAAESGDGVEEPTADLLVAASALVDNDAPADNESAVAEESAESASPPEAVESLAADVVGVESTSAEPVADVASPVEAEAQPQAMMLTDAAPDETDETVMADTESEEVAVVDSQEAEIDEAGRAFVAGAEAEVPQAGATSALVSEPAAAELVVADAPLAEAAAERTQPSAVAMADSAEQSATAQTRQLSSEETMPLVAPSAAEGQPNSVRLFGIAQLLLAILALIFFVIWLRSRSQSATISSQG